MAGGLTLAGAAAVAVSYAQDSLGYGYTELRDAYPCQQGWCVLLKSVTNPGWEDRDAKRVKEARRYRRKPRGIEGEWTHTWGMMLQGDRVVVDDIWPIEYWKRKAEH
jgi:hypothetical protein